MLLARGSYLLLFFLTALRQAAAGPAWKVIEKTFSALTIGIAFENDTTGWTSQTSGSSAIQIVKTTDRYPCARAARLYRGFCI